MCTVIEVLAHFPLCAGSTVEYTYRTVYFTVVQVEYEYLPSVFDREDATQSLAPAHLWVGCRGHPPPELPRLSVGGGPGGLPDSQSRAFAPNQTPEQPTLLVAAGWVGASRVCRSM